MTQWTDDPPSSAPRSWLFVPATRAAGWLGGAASSGAEALIIDLEDGVPADSKRLARDALATVLDQPRRQPWYVRVNATPALLWDDVAAAIAAGCDGIVVPKVEDPAVVDRVGAAIGSGYPPVRYGGGIADGTEIGARARGVGILVLVESARGVLAALELARSHNRVVGLAIGGEDLAADFGVLRSASGLELRAARGLVVLAAAAARRWAIDTPFTHLDRPARLRRECQLVRRMGFTGKLAVHPRQVDAINDCFAPTQGEIEMARQIVSGFGDAWDGAEGVSSLEGRLVDAAVARAARRILARAGEHHSSRADSTGTEKEAD